MWRACIAIAILLAATPALAQDPAPKPDEDRPCDGCPERRVGHALLQAGLYINGLYELANLVRGQDTAKITPKTWWTNMQNGWEWDLDDFVVNQIGHPYQGNNYFTAGRANGLSFWESSAVTALGSGIWEFYGETNQASLNDLINTTLGGIALGEMFHRVGWMVRDPTTTGRGRMWSEIAATALDPLTGVNRFISGDASRVSPKPADLTPSSLTGYTSAGVLWRMDRDGEFTESGSVFLEAEMLYGDPTSGRSRLPYDAFHVRMRFGGGSAISEARVRGRLLGQPTRRGGLQINVSQLYDYLNNNAFEFGAQGFAMDVGKSWTLGTETSLFVVGTGGLTALGAVDSVGVPGKEFEEGETPGQGESVEPRFYDYGPGSIFGGRAIVMRRGRPIVVFTYDGRHLFVIDGPRANHLLQQGRLDLSWPIRGSLGGGLSGEYFIRKTFFQGPENQVTTLKFPQLRVYMTWRMS